MARPRVHPPGTNRMALTRRCLAGRGGKEVKAALEKPALEALETIRQRIEPSTDTNAISASLMAFAKALLRREGKP